MSTSQELQFSAIPMHYDTKSSTLTVTGIYRAVETLNTFIHALQPPDITDFFYDSYCNRDHDHDINAIGL